MRSVLVFVLPVLRAACVPIPPNHSSTTRSNVPDKAPGWIVPGCTTLADVLLREGEPDGGALDERTLSWTRVDGLGGGLLIIPVPAGGIAAFGLTEERHTRMVVRFDRNEVAEGCDVQSASCASGIVGAGNASSEFGGHCLP